MMNCPKCSANLAPHNKFCPGCGLSLGKETLPGEDTVISDTGRTVPLPPASSPRPSTRSSTQLHGPAGGRFVAGDILKNRYRISGLLGRGGMGEVYRAEDLKLGQDVALKFLPPGLDREHDRLARFLNEVRTARQVTHANVCRVYDIDDIDGLHFLSMEYVDGEDLATSLRRFGRLPEERAVEVARQICAGLAAAHEQGILHRDLKPANVMIDGQGRVKLTDFGLAGLADNIDENDVRSGTPAYMSPEQISGREVTRRSDIYSLGVVLYELFTGQAPFQGETAQDFQRLHSEATPSQPTALLPGLDPLVERAIMRCLEKNPARRPDSALAVSAALPGGDPLQAALAAGETPSPELVAQAGQHQGMSSGRAFLMAALAVVLLAGAASWAGRMSILNFAPLDKRPEVLMDRAQEIVGSMGYDEDVYTQPLDTAFGFLRWNDIIQEVRADTSATSWDKLRERPDCMGFWYRQSPRVLLPDAGGGPALLRGQATLTSPMAINPGEVQIVLDLNGRLRRFEVIPKRYSTREAAEPDWSNLFQLADLDSARFQEVRPLYRRFTAPDLRRAWVGTRAHQPRVLVRVEAGAFEGRPVLFNVASQASMMSLGKDPELPAMSPGNIVGNTVQPLLILAVVIFAIRISKRNLSHGRSDTRGAVRFGSIVFFLSLASYSMISHALFTRNFAQEFWPIFVGAVFVSMASWGMYTAAEPMGRRIWPTMFISSSRLLSRRRVQWRDPLIGNSVLVGLLVAGLDFLLRGPVHWTMEARLTGQLPNLAWLDLNLLKGIRPALAAVLDQGLMLGFVFLQIMILVLMRYLFKRRVPAIILTLILWTLLTSPGNLKFALLGLFSSGLFLFVLLRWGVVALVVGRVALGWVWQARPLEWSAWYSQGSVIILGVLIMLAVYGAWAATGKGQVQPVD